MTPTTQKSRAVRAPFERIRLLVKELGSCALSSSGSDEFDETLVIAQLRREPPAAFARRVIDRIIALERTGRRIATAMVQAGERHDAATFGARRAIVLGLAGDARIQDGAAELLLDVPADADRAARQELIGLVDHVLSATQREPLPVRLRFGTSSPPAPERKSGVFWRVLEDPS